jgi:hypothetical protein
MLLFLFRQKGVTLSAARMNTGTSPACVSQAKYKSAMKRINCSTTILITDTDKSQGKIIIFARKY